MNMNRFIRILVAWLFCSLSGYSQTYPVQTNVQLVPPYTPYRADYINAGSEKVMVQLLLKDPTVSNYRVKIRLKIEGVGITIATPESFSGPPIVLQGGIPVMLTSFELAPYFNTKNLQFAGLSKADFQRTGRLPEGLYKFTISVSDFNLNKQVASPASAMAWIMLNDPPLINLPVNNHKVTNIMPQFIAFQWTPRHMGSPNSAFSTEYVFKLVEIWPIERNPNDAILSQRPIYETTTQQTQIVYGPGEPQLIPGRTYAWQVTANDTQKRDLFKNQGRSEVFMFQFGDACNTPKNITIVSHGSTYLRASWNSDPVHQNYSLQYREKGQTEWYGQTTISTQTSISSLKPGVTYEYQVQAGCGQISSDYSPILEASTLAENKSQFVCGSPSVPQQITPGEPLLQILGINDVIYYHNYEVRIKEITSASNGVYSGNAIAVIPYLNYARVRVIFTNIRVAQSYKVAGGEMETVWNPDSEWVYGDEGETSDTGGSSPAAGETKDSTSVTLPEDVITISFDEVIDSVYVNDGGDIVIVDQEGGETIHKRETDEETGEVEEIVVVDGGGSSYRVSKDGVVTKEDADGLAASHAEALADIPPDFTDEFTLAFVDYYVEQLAAYLKANPQYEKGPNATDVVKPELEDLPNCLKTRQGDLSYIKAYLVQIKADAAKRSYFVRILQTECAEYVEGLIEAREKRKVKGYENRPIKELFSESDWNIIVHAICEWVIDPAKEYHVTKKLKLLNDNTFSECFERGLDKAMDEFFSAFDLAVQAGWTEMGLCLTEKGSCGSSYMEEFTCGVTNALIQEFDVLSISQGAAQILVSQFKNRFECLIDEGGPVAVFTAETKSEGVYLTSKCVLGVSMTLEEWEALYSKVEGYVSSNWTDPYLHGQATVFVATIAIPFTKLSKAKLITRLSAMKGFSSHTEELTKISKAADEGGDVGKVVDEIHPKIKLVSKYPVEGFREMALTWTGEKAYRFKKADLFYQNNKTGDVYLSQIDDELRAIDFDMPVLDATFKQGEFVYQWVYPKRGTLNEFTMDNVGSYFIKDPTLQPEVIGIPRDNRILRKFKVTKDLEALESTASDVQWRDRDVVYSGGGKQFFRPNAQKFLELVKN